MARIEQEIPVLAQELGKHWQEDKTFHPVASAASIQQQVRGWQRAVKASIAWANDEGAGR